MAGQSLFQVVNQALTKQLNKSAIGYSVKSYANVLDDLQRQEYTQEQSTNNGNQVFGITRTDYSGVSSMNFDENTGMSQNSDAIWKMKITTTGACPVKYEEAFDIVKFGHEGLTNSNRNPFTTTTEMLPFALESDKLKEIQVENFKVGAAIDLHNLAVVYFNKYFTNSNVKSIDSKMITDLLTQGCLRAQVIFPSNNKSLFVDIIQHTPFSNMACIYLSTPIASAAQWKDCGITVKVKAQGKVQSFIPDGTTYVSAVAGQTYYVGKGTMGGMTKKNYQEWLKHSASTYVVPAKHILQLVKGELKDCYVRLFIPKEKQGEARKILPDRINESIFKSWQGVQITEGGTVDNSAQGDLSVTLQGLCRSWYGVRANDGQGTIIYSYHSGKTCRTLSRGAGGTFYSSSVGQIKPKFGSTKDNLYLDCSAFATFILLNSTAIRDDVPSVTTYSTGTMKQFTQYLNTILKPGYKAILFDNTDHKQIKTGDLMYCDSREKGQYNGRHEGAGHAAIAYIKDGRVHTLEINSKEPQNVGKLKDRNEVPRRGKYFYRHIVRIIKE